MHRIILILLAAVFSLLLFAVRPWSVHAAVTVTPAGDGHVTVPTFVDGKGPFPFIVDTGADGSAVYQWFAQRAKLPKISGRSETLSGMTGPVAAATYRARNIGVDGHEASDVVVDVLPDRRDKGREAGVIGNDFLDRTVTVFDFACRRIAMYPTLDSIRSIVGNNGAPVRATRAPGTSLLQFPVLVNGVRATAVLDTGDRATKLNTRLARLAGINPRSRAFRDAPPVFGADGRPLVPRVGPIGTVEFGGVRLTNVRAQVADVAIISQLYGAKPILWLGADLLQSVRVVYDHHANRIWFRPSACAK